MSLKVRKAGAWANTGTVKVMKSGSWATATFVKAMKAGAWVLVWPELTATLVATNIVHTDVGAAAATITYRIGSDGSAYEKYGGAAFSFLHVWLTAGANTNFEVRFTETSSNGLGTTTGTLNTWLPTTSNNDITLLGPIGGATATRIYTVEIRETVVNTTVASASIGMSSTRL